MVSVISQELMGVQRVFSSQKDKITIVPSVTVSNLGGVDGKRTTQVVEKK